MASLGAIATSTLPCTSALPNDIEALGNAAVEKLLRIFWVWAPAISLALLVGGCGQSTSAKKDEAPDSKPGSAVTSAPPPAMAAAPMTTVPMTKAGGPKRADGFWEFKWGEATKQYCVGDDSEEKYSLVDELSLLGDCSKKEFKRTARSWDFETVCVMMGVTTTQKGTITGDFKTNYTIDQQVTQSPGSSVKGQIVAHRIGDCPPQYKPGDMIKDGFKINMAK